MNRLTKFQRSKLGIEMLSTLVTLCELGRRVGWDDISKIPVEAIIKRWKAKGCEKGQSRRLKKLFADGRVVDALTSKPVPSNDSNYGAGEFIVSLQGHLNDLEVGLAHHVILSYSGKARFTFGDDPESADGEGGT